MKANRVYRGSSRSGGGRASHHANNSSLSTFTAKAPKKGGKGKAKGKGKSSKKPKSVKSENNTKPKKEKIDNSNIEDAVIVNDSPKSTPALGAAPKPKKSSTPKPPGMKRESGRKERVPGQPKPMKVGQQFTSVNTKGEATKMVQTKFGPAVDLRDI